MTPPDHDPLLDDDGPLDDDTLAVHAVVDDEATAEQRRRVARDPELVARVADLRAAVAAVAAPVDPPGEDVLAALRHRALDAADEDTDGADEDDERVEDAAGPPARVQDLGAARARRSRSLPPLPAVAAVVVLLVAVGVGLLVAGTGGNDEDSADSASSGAASEETTSANGADDDGEQEAAGDASEATEDGFQAERPADERRDELLGQATARYAAEDDLLTDLRRVDPERLALSGSAVTEDEGGAPSTTAGAGASTTTRLPSGAAAEAYALDPVVTRCDDVLRAAEPDLGPVTAAVLVEVDGVPVLVLSNPVEVSDDAPSGVRLTVLNAVDCSPRAAVLR